MNVFTASPRHQPWLWQVTGLCFVLGLLLAGSLQTVSNVQRTGWAVRVGVPSPSGGAGFPDTVRKRDKEIADLREKQTKLENTMAAGNDRLKALNDELQRSKLLSGLSAVEGPGISLILRDGKPPTSRGFDLPKYIIHDYDLQMVVNELLASGAEAVAINGQRISARTAVRCVGPTILVNFAPIGPPYEILALGDAGNLSAGLNLPGGYLDELRSTDPSMYRLERRTHIVLPAYTGSTEVRYARPVAERTQAQEERSSQ